MVDMIVKKSVIVYFKAFLACWIVGAVVLLLLNEIMKTGKYNSLLFVFCNSFGMSVLITTVLYFSRNRNLKNQ